MQVQAAKATSHGKAAPVAMTDEIVVDNPAEDAERLIHPTIKATRTLRDDPVGQMHARGQLGRRDEGDARLARARLFQATWEASGRGMIRSADMLSSGGGDPTRRSGINDRQLAAARQLSRWHVDLGRVGFDLLVAVLIDKCTISEMARHRHGNATRTAVIYTGNRFRECLDALS